MPSTWPFHEPVARIESRCGISIEYDGVWSLCVKPPIWKSENEHGAHVSHYASVAAIFIGWACVVSMPKWLPYQRLKVETGTRTISASLAARMKSSTLRPRSRCQQATPRTTDEPTVRPANRTWP
jgi:hypothetical protein